jgi:stage V sporulation protein SpoVS
MAKDYQKGADYRLYLNTGTYGSPTWVEIKAVGDITVNANADDVAVPERGMATGHLQGEDDPEITFTLYEDEGDANVETMIAAVYSGALKEIAVCRGSIASGGNKYVRLESCLWGANSANRSDPGQYEITARRHANSDYGLTRATGTA